MLTLPDNHSLYFSDTQLSISCNNTHTNLVVSGLRLRRLDSRLVTLRSSRRFFFSYTPSSLPPTLLDLPVKNISLPITDVVRLLPSFSDQLNPFDFIPSSHVIYDFPVLSTIFGTSIVALGFVLYRCLLIKTLAGRLSFGSDTANTASP